MTRSKLIKAINNPRTAVNHLIGRLISLRVSTHLFGNPTGVRSNVIGRYSQWKHSDGMSERSPEVEKLRRHGYYSIGVPFDDDFIRTLQERYHALIEEEETSYVRGEHDGEVFSRGLLLAHENLPEFGDLLTDEIKSMVRQYYGSHFRVKYLISWRNYHVPQETIDEAPGNIFSEDWHCDRRRTDILKLFVNLSDVTEDHGPFHIMSRDATRRVAKVEKNDRVGLYVGENLVNDDEIVKATGPAGSALLCNTELCYHRAGLPTEGNHRDIVQFQFMPADEPLGDNWLDEVETKPFERRLLDERSG